MEIDGYGGGKRGKGQRGRSAKRARGRPRDVPAVLRARGLRPEIKLVDSGTLTSTFDSSATRVTALNLTLQGAAETNRIGRKICLKSLMIRGQVLFRQQGAAPAPDFLRCLLVYDRQPNGATPALGDVLQNTDINGTNTTDAMAMVNISNADRFKILRDWYWNMAGVVQVAAAGPPITYTQAQIPAIDYKPTSFKAFVKLLGWETHYNGVNGGTIADVTTGALLLFTVGMNSLANSQYTLQFSTRVRFSDM